ncbi:MAG TPA: hypothetical protein VM370_12005 [Candidatus Thermoplasmatota archaeon]|nr:hypothetical protein [Candidatus Thermoplasmatota archaeon]
MRALVWLARTQAAYFTSTGAWALVHIESFMAVTGPKTDVWLVKTVAALLLATGLTLFAAALRLRIPFEIALLAILTALALAAIDLGYTAAGTIRWVYALDGITETALALAWVAALWRARHDARTWGRSAPGNE